MKNLIKKILKEDFDWINDIPSFIEVTEPVSQNNPKDMFRLNWTNSHYTGDYDVWADEWYNFKNDSDGITKLTRFVKILQNGVNPRSDDFDFNLLSDLYFKGGHDYIVTKEMENILSNLSDYDEEEKKEKLVEMLEENLSDLGVYQYNSSLQRWRVTYFDENGIEFNTKINIV
jgi:hypothetical protein